MMGYLDDNTSAVKNAHYYRRELKKAEQHIRELEAELAALRQQQGWPFLFVAYDEESGEAEIRDPADPRNKNLIPLYREAAPKQQGEPFGWAFQHDETGRWVSVINDGVNNPVKFAENNPRYSGPILFYREAAPRVPEGWKMVPVEPTEEMAKEYWTFNDRTDVVMADAWKAMLAAAPEPKE